MSSLQKYASYIFSDTGRPCYGESVTYEADKGGRPKRRRVRYTLTQWFLEPSFADNSARFASLRTALAVPEAVLRIEDENGTVLVNRRVRVLTHELPEQWGANLLEVKVAFEAVEEITASVFDATFTPTGGDPVTLPRVDGWRETTQAERYSTLVPERRESRLVINATGIIRANPEDAPATRLSALVTAAAALRACDRKEGVLAFSGSDFSQTMRVDSLVSDLGDGSDELHWSLTASMLRFPAGNYAEARYDIKVADNLQTCERMTVLAGEIRAHDEAGAAAKRDTIRDAYATGRALLASGFDKKKVDATDGAEDLREWTFSLTFREVLPDAQPSYKLDISDKTDFTSGIITSSYTGTVCATASAAAITLARTLGGGKYPLKVSEDLTVSSLSSAGSAAQFTQVAFSFIYHRRGSEKHAEVTSETARNDFGACAVTVSGTCAADTEANAKTFADTFLPAGLLTEKRVSAATAYHGDTPDSLFQRVSFSFGVVTGNVAGTLDYGLDVTEDFDALTTTRTWAGMARAANKAAADTLIDGLLSGAPGSRTRNQRKAIYKTGASSVFLGIEFTVTYVGALSAADAVLSATYSVETVFSENATVVTPIPYGTPHVQEAVGWTPGAITVTGTVKSVTETPARTFARALFSWGVGGYALPKREKVKFTLLPRSTTEVQVVELEFTYPWVFATLVM